MGTIEARNTSYWIESSERTQFPALDADLATDVAVVGGGITGLTTAYLLAREGVRVTVVEAGSICAGATGYTTGKVTSQHRLIYARLARRHGVERATAYAASQQHAIERIATIADEARIDCELRRAPSYVFTEDPRRLRYLHEEFETARRLGLPAHETNVDIGLPWHVVGAIRFDDQIAFHPRKYCLGLADAIVRLGGEIFEHTRATGAGDGLVATERATITADAVVLATQTPFTFGGLFFARTKPVRSYVLAARMGAPPEGMYINAEEPVRSVRAHFSASGNVVMIGGGGHATGRAAPTGDEYAALEKWAAERFGIAPEWRWSAQDFVPADGLPFVGPVTAHSARTFVATGFAKWGMTNGTVAATLISDAILGRENLWREAFDSTRIDAVKSTRIVLEQGAETAKSLVADRLAVLAARGARALEPGTGAVVREGAHAVAAFRDEDGTISACSATCTHLGCIVHFNDAERTWDCPCHGSRFGLDGRVLDGPATKDLERIPIEEAARLP